MEQETYSYRPGARGFVVQRLQIALGIAADGAFGSQTATRLRNLQRDHGQVVTGCAGKLEFEILGQRWPDEFERAMNLVCCFEGTSFGDCNLTDIDGAGLTMGIAGFTTAHGEVQSLLAAYLVKSESQFVAHLPGPAFEETKALIRQQSRPDAWKAHFYDSRGRVQPYWRAALQQFGHDVIMQELQLAMAHDRFWKPATATAGRLGFKSLQARCFFLDVAVQNGGWRDTHRRRAKRYPEWTSGDETRRLEAAAMAVALQSRRQWQFDVKARKLTIARSQGTVHDRHFNLASYALLPIETPTVAVGAGARSGAPE